MADILDELLFSTFTTDTQTNKCQSFLDHEILALALKKISISGCIFKQNPCPSSVIFSFLHEMYQTKFLVQIDFQQGTQSVEWKYQPLKGSVFFPTFSKHQSIILCKEIHKSHQNHYPIKLCLVNGNIQAVASLHFYKITVDRKNTLIDFFTFMIRNHLYQCQLQIKKLVKYLKFQLRDNQIEAQYKKGIRNTQNLMTIISCFEISESKTNELAIHRQHSIQHKQVLTILHSIDDNFYDKIKFMRLFQYKIYDKSKRINTKSFIEESEEDFSKYKNLLNVVKYCSNEQKLYQSLYTKIKIKSYEQVSQICFQGGVCDIQVLRAKVYHLDHNNQQTKDTYLAIKKLKSLFAKKYKHKIQHQKLIVSKLQGSSSQFIARYYNLQYQAIFTQAIIMQFLAGEELNNYLLNRSLSISLWSKIYILINIAEGLRHLISQNIVHLDLKPNNIIVGRCMLPKIIDFGEAFHPQFCNSSYIPGFTLPYAAPEIFSKAQNDRKNIKFKYSQKQDVFAFGHLIFQVIFERAFPLDKSKLRYAYISKQYLKYWFYIPEGSFSIGEYEVIAPLLYLASRCLEENLDQRPYVDWIIIILKLILQLYLKT